MYMEKARVTTCAGFVEQCDTTLPPYHHYQALLPEGVLFLPAVLGAIISRSIREGSNPSLDLIRHLPGR